MTKQELAIAEQSEKMRETLRRIRSGECPANYPLTLQGLTNFHVALAKEALSLPDLATPVLNKIKAEAYREAALYCESRNSNREYPYACYDQGYDDAASDCSEAIRAKADELEQSK